MSSGVKRLAGAAAQKIGGKKGVAAFKAEYKKAAKSKKAKK